MKFSIASLVGTSLFFASQANAVLWYFLTYHPPSGQQFVGFSGEMHIPPLPRADVYYLWPGLQPTDNSGVYQNVLDGRSGTWWIGSGWCCENPSLPWGDGFNVAAGDVVDFSNTKGSSTWTSTLRKEGASNNVSNSFALSSKNFNQAIFAIELQGGATWDFGPLTFTNVVITATGSDTSFCNSSPSNYNSATRFTISGVSAVVGNGVVNCHISSVVLQGPA